MNNNDDKNEREREKERKREREKERKREGKGMDRKCMMKDIEDDWSPEGINLGVVGGATGALMPHADAIPGADSPDSPPRSPQPSPLTSPYPLKVARNLEVGNRGSTGLTGAGIE